jgi:hypothetical protein
MGSDYGSNISDLSINYVGKCQGGELNLSCFKRIFCLINTVFLMVE